MKREKGPAPRDARAVSPARIIAVSFAIVIALGTLLLLLPACTAPVCYNGDVTTVDDLRALEAAFPELSGIMVGRGLIADPALLRKAVGGPAASREELRGYHDELYHGYTEAFGMASCAVSRMKAHWFYLIHLFDGADALEKPLRKAREGWEYETVVNQIFACWPK